VVFFERRSLETSKTLIVFAFIVCGWVVFKHRANILRLRDGTEGQADPGNTPEDSERKGE